ncbi:MAG TPA: sulfur carrier protein ThiS [bacterium]
MKVEINGALHTVETVTTITGLLQKLNINPEQGVAVALNYDVVSKSDFAKTRLKAGDKIEIIHATAGG